MILYYIILYYIILSQIYIPKKRGVFLFVFFGGGRGGNPCLWISLEEGGVGYEMHIDQMHCLLLKASTLNAGHIVKLIIKN